MTSRAVARQYALALFDVAQKGGQTDRIGRELAEFAALVRSHEELSGVLSNARFRRRGNAPSSMRSSGRCRS